MRIVDLQKDAFAFKRDVVVPTMCVSDGVGAGSGNKNHPRATTFGSVNSVDRVVRYFQCKILSMDATVGKLRLELSHQRNKAQRIDVQLKQKEKAGSSFHYIDFHQVSWDKRDLYLRVTRWLKCPFIGSNCYHYDDFTIKNTSHCSTIDSYR